jgi:PadR family transcriptional regulator PadR
VETATCHGQVAYILNVFRETPPMDALFFRNWTDQIRKGLLELAILNDIRDRGMYGYEIERKLRKSEGLLLGRGVIYKMLRRFVRHHLVSVTDVKSPEGPRRRYYLLTDSGHDTLIQMNAYWDAIKRQTDTVAAGGSRTRPPASGPRVRDGEDGYRRAGNAPAADIHS